MHKDRLGQGHVGEHDRLVFPFLEFWNWEINFSLMLGFVVLFFFFLRFFAERCTTIGD